MQETPGLTHFLTQTDALGHVILVVLLAMSVATWYLIATKSWTNRKMRRAATDFQRMFWDAPDMKLVSDYIRLHGVNDPFSHLTHHGLRAVEQHRDKRGGRMIESGSADEFLTRALRRAIEQDTARMEYGLTVLGSVASAAPFVGLFGTVWGIYHALLAIGISGAGTLDKVAGPVGEALVMTALGLAVAIPAVLAFNAFARYNRVMLSEVDGFAHDLFAFMSTGNRSEATSPAGPVRALRPAAGAA
jgi:biopolymer transport protein ExbB